MTGSGGQRRVPAAYLSGLKVPLPSLHEQRRIAEVLDRAETLRAQRRQALAQLDVLAEAIFSTEFGSGARHAQRWRQVGLGEIGDVQGGLQLSAKRSQLPVTVPYLRVANVHRGRLDLGEIKTFTVTANELGRTRLIAGDLLFVEGHGNPAEIGRCAIWDGSIDPCSHQNHLIRLRVDRSIADPTFVAWFLNSPDGRWDLLRAGKTTSGLNTISVNDVREARVTLPPIELQREFADVVAAIERNKATHNAAASQLNALFASLQHRAFRGEL